MLPPRKKDAPISKCLARLTALALSLASALPSGAFVAVTFEDKPGTGGCMAVFNSCFYQHMSEPNAGAICQQVLTQCEASSGTTVKTLSSFTKRPSDRTPIKQRTGSGVDSASTDGGTGDARPVKKADYSDLTPQKMTGLIYKDFFPNSSGTAGSGETGAATETPEIRLMGQPPHP